MKRGHRWIFAGTALACLLFPGYPISVPTAVAIQPLGTEDQAWIETVRAAIAKRFEAQIAIPP